MIPVSPYNSFESLVSFEASIKEKKTTTTNKNKINKKKLHQKRKNKGKKTSRASRINALSSDTAMKTNLLNYSNIQVRSGKA